MRNSGRIVTWNFEKGFGFAEPDSGGSDVFIHITEFVDRSYPPEVGQPVTYALTKDAKGRIRGERVRRKGDNVSVNLRASRIGYFLPLAFLVCVAAFSVLGFLPMEIAYFYFAISFITYLIYAFDKSAAIHGRWRTPEITLHLAALLGGWPGAAIAQKIIRHKSKKIEFQLVYWLTVIINIIAYSLLFTIEGRLLLDRLLSQIKSVL